MPKPTIVLVHGAWADASSWNAVATELEDQGFTVLAPPNLLRGVAIDAAYIASFLAAAHHRARRPRRPLVRRFRHHQRRDRRGRRASAGLRRRVHPRRGRERLPDPRRVGSALAVPDPTTVLDIAGYPGAPEGDAEAFLKPDTVHTAFAQDLPEADRWLIVASQRPITLSANTAPSQTAAWKTLPTWAVIGTRGPRHPARHPAQHGGARRSHDQRGRGLTRLDGLAAPGDDRRRPRRRSRRLTVRDPRRVRATAVRWPRLPWQPWSRSERHPLDRQVLAVDRRHRVVRVPAL